MKNEKRKKHGGKLAVGQYNKHCGCGWEGAAKDYRNHVKEKHA